MYMTAYTVLAVRHRLAAIVRFNEPWKLTLFKRPEDTERTYKRKKKVKTCWGYAASCCTRPPLIDSAGMRERARQGIQYTTVYTVYADD